MRYVVELVWTGVERVVVQAQSAEEAEDRALDAIEDVPGPEVDFGEGCSAHAVLGELR